MPSNMPDARAVNEALRRAREMQNRSQAQIAPADSMPTEQKPEEKPETPSSPVTTMQRTSPLDLLLKDKERTLILALLILLSSEGNNTELLFALMYLLI